MKSITERALDAEVRGSRWLADGNMAEDPAYADECYRKAQFWLDRYNLLTGRSDRDPPKH